MHHAALRGQLASKAPEMQQGCAALCRQVLHLMLGWAEF